MRTQTREALEDRERDELCDLMEKLGPDAPTLCEGWTTLDLAAHLVAREHKLLRAGPGALLGNRIPPLARMADDIHAELKAQGLPELVTTLRQGPGPLFRIPGAGGLVQLPEYFVHHEDVRRANGYEPRTDRSDLDDKLWSRVKSVAKLRLLRFRPYGVDLVAPGRGAFQARKGRDIVTVSGGPQELTLYFFGRQQAAQVELSGDPKAVKALGNHSFGL